MEVNIKSSDIVETIRQVLETRKGRKITILDVRSRTDITDYFIIVSGYSSAHIKALAGEVESTLKQKGIICYNVSGTPSSGWMVLDYIDVVVHIFSLQARDYYSLEQLWDISSHKTNSVVQT